MKSKYIMFPLSIMAVGYILLFNQESQDRQELAQEVAEVKLILAEQGADVSSIQNELNQHSDAISKIQIDELENEVERLRKRIDDGKLIYQYNLSEADISLLERLVEAEAGSEPYMGKIAVANVVFNRIDSPKYPNTLKEVIYQENQFEVVKIGTIDTKIPSEETKKAVKEALQGRTTVPKDTVIFWASYLNKSHPIWTSCVITKTIGGHHFSNSWE